MVAGNSVNLLGCDTYTRQGNTRAAQGSDFGLVTTDINGNGALAVLIQNIPAGTYELEFLARSCGSCAGAPFHSVIFQAPGPRFGASGSTVSIKVSPNR
jgi:hypothetical protein